MGLIKWRANTLVKIKIKSTTINPSIVDILGDTRLWDLVNDIILEKQSFYNGVLRGGDISDLLLKKISRVLVEVKRDKIKAKIRVGDGDKYKNLTEGREAIGKY
jgi:hypothetical protein